MADPTEEADHTSASRDETGSTIDGIDGAEQQQRPLIIIGDGQEFLSSAPAARRAPMRRHSAHAYYSFPSTPYFANLQLPSNREVDDAFESSSGSDDDDDDEALRIPTWSRPPSTPLQRIGRSARTVWRKVTGFLTPPLWASLISLFVALCQPLQHLLEVHMHPVQGAITQAGNCSIPITLVVLGAYFYRPPEKPKSPTASSAGWQTASFASGLREIFRLKAREQDRRPITPHREGMGEGKTVFVAILARMVVVPALFLPFIAFGAFWTHLPVFEE
jgi:hypothetical protein